MFFFRLSNCRQVHFSSFNFQNRTLGTDLRRRAPKIATADGFWSGPNAKLARRTSPTPPSSSGSSSHPTIVTVSSSPPSFLPSTSCPWIPRCHRRRTSRSRQVECSHAPMAGHRNPTHPLLQALLPLQLRQPHPRPRYNPSFISVLLPQ